MPDRLRKLKKLRETWGIRKKAMEHRIAHANIKVSSIGVEEQHLVQVLSTASGAEGLFPEIVTQRLARLSNLKAQLHAELDDMHKDHLDQSLNHRRSEILEDRQRAHVEHVRENAALEATLEVFLSPLKTKP